MRILLRNKALFRLRWGLSGARNNSFMRFAEAELGGALGVENRVAMLAERHARLHFFAARGAIHLPLRDVSPFAFEAHGHGSAPVHVRDFAIRMTARPHLVRFGDKLLIP